MRHVRLVAFEDYYGNVGLGFKGHTSHPELVASRDGVLIAHDIVEHQNGLDAIGCVADELQALGSVWHIRGQHGFPEQRSYFSPEYSLATDIAKCAMDLDNEDQRWQPRYGQYRTWEHYQDEAFDCILEEAKPLIRSGREHCEGFFDMQAYLENAKHLLRVGYRKSERRWGERHDGLDMFNRIRDAVAPHAKHCEEGQEFRLSYGNGQAICQEVYEEPYW